MTRLKKSSQNGSKLIKQKYGGLKACILRLSIQTL